MVQTKPETELFPAIRQQSWGGKHFTAKDCRFGEEENNLRIFFGASLRTSLTVIIIRQGGL